ncbi:phytoene desaturase family protein [Litoribacter populi]|uniref:phytoene desaturase family protein n=1 Tax=Litoribacter populi TaxID=2598460 RepID=UPI00117CB22D|nr:phytoene desaturase family protein [Litoribacter populi]
MSKNQVVVIGAGFAGLSAATHLAHQGYQVTLLEKNGTPGGRARKFEAEGFIFDMGPSWYWMPDVFDKYFAFFGKKTSDYYELIRLDPSYSVYFGENDRLDVPASLEELKEIFEEIEPGSKKQLELFLEQAAYKYQVGIQDFVYRPSKSMLEFTQVSLVKDLIKLDLFQSMSRHLRKYFKSPRILQLLEFPVLFLGQTAEKIPALYSLMNYADIKLGTWYPLGGMHEIIAAMVALAEEKGVKIIYDAEVDYIQTKQSEATAVVLKDNTRHELDILIGGADYHHIDRHLLPPNVSNYPEKYWNKRVMAPSSLIFYLGVDKKLKSLHHHNLFFDESLAEHADAIYTNPRWPEKPLFYVCAPSVTDPSVAPEGKENLFVLVPLAPDLKDDEETREKYYHMVMERLEKYINEPVRKHIIYKRSYAHADFSKDYHAFKGNAYGLANTLTQTAFLKPTLKNKNLNNLYYTGQLTVPGPGVPPSLISGEVVAKEVMKDFKLSTVTI